MTSPLLKLKSRPRLIAKSRLDKPSAHSRSKLQPCRKSARALEFRSRDHPQLLPTPLFSHFLRLGGAEDVALEPLLFPHVTGKLHTTIQVGEDVVYDPGVFVVRPGSRLPHRRLQDLLHTDRHAMDLILPTEGVPGMSQFVTDRGMRV